MQNLIAFPWSPRTLCTLLHLREAHLARENTGWGYDRIVGALSNLGYTESDDALQRDLLGISILEPNLCSIARPIFNFGDDRSDRDGAYRQQRSSDQVIKKAALSDLKASENRHIELLLRR